MKKLIFALFVVVALLVVVMPAAAQGPNPYKLVFYDRTPEMGSAKAWLDAGGDPFGGNAKYGVAVTYVPDGKGSVTAQVNGSGAALSWTFKVDPNNNVLPFPSNGIVAKFGLQPYGVDRIQQGGLPSSASGDGSGPRKAIFIGGAWADAALNPVGTNCWSWDPNGDWLFKCRAENQTPYELPACATAQVPAGTSKWFKLDTWYRDNAGRPLYTQIWLDDELDGATKPSGKAVFGAANLWFYGTAPFDGWGPNANTAPQDWNNINGWRMEIYDPDVLQPNYAFAPPNAWIFTLDVSGTGSLRRSCTAAAYAGQPCVSAASGGNSAPAGNSFATTGYHNIRTDKDGNIKVWNGNTGFAEWVGLGSNAVKGLANYNPNQPSHLLWYEGHWDGWVFARVMNQMIWNGTATVCSYRAIREVPAAR